MAITAPPVVDEFANTVAGTPSDLWDVPTYLDSGFPAPAGVPVRPPLGFFNWLFWFLTKGIRYFMSRGLPQWISGETEYTPGSVVFNGDFYHWMLVNGGTATPGTNPDADTTNWSRLNMRDRANLADYGKEAGVWRNYRGQRRQGFDYWGNLNGNVVSWDEQWDDIALLSVTTAGQTDGARWSANLIAGTGSAVVEHQPQYTAGSNNGYRFLGITAPTTGGRAEIQRNGAGFTAVFTDDITVGMFWPFLLTVGATTNCTFIMGFNAGNTHVDNLANAAYVYKSPTDTNWQFVSVSGGVASSPVDTGIAASSGTVHRAGLVLEGANQVDSGGIAKAKLLIDGSIVGTITTHLPYTTGGAGAGLQLSPIFGSVTTATASERELLVGPVRYRQNMFPGDVGVV
jgi:hypothetical protein